MDQVVMSIDANLLDYLVSKDVRIEELALLLMLDRPKLLESYLRRLATKDQKATVLQALVRKMLVDLKEDDSFKLENYTLSTKGLEIITYTGIQAQTIEIKFLSEFDVPQFDKFIQEYLELFPKGIRNGGNKPLRSNVTDVTNKMHKFINKYKYTTEIILKATEHYLEKLRGVYTYCPTSEYFIMKDGSSALATECANVKNGSNNVENINPFEKRM